MKSGDAGTRATLVRTAARLIRGAASVRDITVRKIIRKAGVNLNAVNYHFGSKENLVRESVRSIIGRYFEERGMTPGSTGPDLLPNLIRICDFLFSEPVASRLALDSELGVDGAGHSLSSETLESILGMIRHDIPHLDEEEARFRAWAILSVAHQCFLRPAGCAEWLGMDPRDKPTRDDLLQRLCRLAGLPVGARKE